MPYTWTDDPLFANQTPIRKIHIEELRNATNNERISHGLGTYTWTDDPLFANQTPIRKIHIEELRNAIDELSCSTYYFTDYSNYNRTVDGSNDSDVYSGYETTQYATYCSTVYNNRQSSDAGSNNSPDNYQDFSNAVQYYPDYYTGEDWDCFGQ